MANVVTAGALMRWDVINELLGATAKKRYLEIGVQNGHCGMRVNAGVKWGVDPDPRAAAPARYSNFYRGRSDAFFADRPLEQQFDVVFVDGLHHAEQVERDVDNALRCLAPGGFIVLHDCNPASERAQAVPRVTGVWNGDCWKAAVRLRQRADLDTFVIDTDHGLGIVRRKPNPSPLQGVPSPLRYEHLEADRERLLGLVPPGRWAERVGQPLAVGKLVVVTAIFGDRDVPLPAPPAGDVDRFVMFTDGPGAPGWEVRPRESALGPDPRLAARHIKTRALDFVDGDVVVWVDGRIALSGQPLRPLLRGALRAADVAGFPHPWRHCIFDEARECAALRLADAGALAAQTAAYSAAGYPRRHGLWNTMVLARRRSPATLELGEAWWAEVERHTARDQISFPYVLWFHGMRCAELGRDVYRAGASEHFRRGQHKATA